MRDIYMCILLSAIRYEYAQRLMITSTSVLATTLLLYSYLGPCTFDSPDLCLHLDSLWDTATHAELKLV